MYQSSGTNNNKTQDEIVPKVAGLSQQLAYLYYILPITEKQSGHAIFPLDIETQGSGSVDHPLALFLGEPRSFALSAILARVYNVVIALLQRTESVVLACATGDDVCSVVELS